jgi:hypothetical protein
MYKKNVDEDCTAQVGRNKDVTDHNYKAHRRLDHVHTRNIIMQMTKEKWARHAEHDHRERQQHEGISSTSV